MPDETAWVLLTDAQVTEVLKRELAQGFNENTVTDLQANAPFDPNQAHRQQALVWHGVDACRASIRLGGRCPLSVADDAVPPEAVVHILTWAAWRLAISNASLQMFIISEKGAVSPFGMLYKEAVDYFAKLDAGKPVTPPTVPTGIDYATAVSSTNPAICAVSWSDMRMTDVEYANEEKDALDLTTD